MSVNTKKIHSFLEQFTTYVAAVGGGCYMGAVLSALFTLFITGKKLDKVLPEYLCTLIAVCIFIIPIIVFLFIAFRFEKKLKNTENSPQVRKSRLGTFFLLGTPAFLLITAGFFAAFSLENDLLLLPGLFLFLFILFYSIFRPVESDIRRGNIKAFSFLFSLGLFFICGLILGRTGDVLSYTGNNAAEIKKLSSRQKEICFPPNATKIRLSGTTMSFEYSCHVKEKDFLSYMAKSSFEFKKITEQKKFDKNPVPYYECVNRGKDGGGWSFRYIVPEKKFFGAYSNH
ncbi:MAG: hypothetical protein J6S53_01075 [Lentisphaeria bacterium]|nr:hypothetical protein [Lentisphaeria bacterium]